MTGANIAANRHAVHRSSGDRLVDIAQQLAAARELSAVIEAVRSGARAVLRADGVTFVLREADVVHYAEENAIAPLWKGRRFPIGCCISGWAMLHRQTVAIEDIFADPRIPRSAYEPTFVKSLAMVPVAVGDEPVAAIGAYWAERHMATGDELRHLETIAGLASVALVNVKLDADLRAAVRARDEFIAIASHELRSPLTAAKIQVQHASRALARGDDVATVQEALERATRSTTRLAKLVEGLLDVSRVAQNRIQLTLEPLSLAELTRAAIDRVRETAQHAVVRLDVDGDPRGEWDRARVVQVIESLTTNAVKFGGDRPVDVYVGGDESVALLAVTDHGIGIAPEHQARIFEPFERAVSSRHYGGFGLGLWLARQIVEAHGGSIAVDSRPGSGSTFTVRLPSAGRVPVSASA